jgi:ribonuclease P/MRP protein subunit RPP1
MNTTDACVFPYPNGDSSARRMAMEARELGYDSMIAIGQPGFRIEGFQVFRGEVLQCRTASQLASALRQGKASDAITLVNAGDSIFNRAAVGMKRVRILRNIHATDRNSFDHVTARIASERSIGIDLDLHPVIKLRGGQRQRVLERYRDIVRLHERIGFEIVLSSNAASILDLRSPDELIGLCSLFGMDEAGAEHALSSSGRLLAPREAVRVVG